MNCSNSSHFYLGVAGTVACIAGAAFLGTQWASLDLATRVEPQRELASPKSHALPSL